MVACFDVELIEDNKPLVVAPKVFGVGAEKPDRHVPFRMRRHGIHFSLPQLGRICIQKYNLIVHESPIIK